MWGHFFHVNMFKKRVMFNFPHHFLIPKVIKTRFKDINLITVRGFHGFFVSKRFG